MSSFKRVKGDYIIQSVGATDNVVVNTNTLAVNGNLDVVGNLTYINVEELNIRDPFIMLNSSNANTYSANSGILTHKTANTYAGLRYNRALTQWEISTGTDPAGESGTWQQIASGNVTIAGSNTEIQFNNAGLFGASANFTFDQNTNTLTILGPAVLGNIAAPTAPANSVAVYHSTVGAGDTGVYAKTTQQDVELVSKKRAIVFGIIF